MFCASIRKDLVSLSKFPFQVFSRAIFLICRLKYPYSCFSSYFCFLVFCCFSLCSYVASAATGCCNNPSLIFLIQSSSRYIDASTQSTMRFPPSVLNIYNLSMSFLAIKALGMVNSFLVLSSICLSSSHIDFNNAFGYLIINTAQVLISLTRFLLRNLVLRNFLSLLRYSNF